MNYIYISYLGHSCVRWIANIEHYSLVNCHSQQCHRSICECQSGLITQMSNETVKINRAFTAGRKALRALWTTSNWMTKSHQFSILIHRGRPTLCLNQSKNQMLQTFFRTTINPSSAHSVFVLTNAIVSGSWTRVWLIFSASPNNGRPTRLPSLTWILISSFVDSSFPPIKWRTIHSLQTS